MGHARRVILPGGQNRNSVTEDETKAEKKI